MADLYTPKTWVDGEQVNAVQLNRIETGAEAIDLDLDDLRDQVAALLAGGGSSRQIQSGTTAQRPSPAIGLPYLDISLGTKGKVIWGTGTSWIYADGTEVETAGSSASPKNMKAVVQAGGTIGQIVLSWDPVVGADSYKLYELESPSGVSGATALTSTTSTRTPGTARNYEYWVTATIGGIESAASNHVTAVLPFSGGGGGGTTSDPSTFLNINGKGTGTGGWWNLGIGFESGHTDITPTQLQNGYVNSPYYVMNAAGTAVQMQVFMNGGRTSANTKYPRSELREYATGSTSTKASWNGTSGRHIMRGKTKVMHYAPEKCEMVVAQIHDGSDDRLQIRAEASSPTASQTWRLSLDGTEVDDLISGVALGQEVSWEIDVNAGALTVKINGATAYSNSDAGLPSSGNYFKVGTYVQQNSTDQDNPSSEYGRSELRDLFVSHS